jgi:hypothetical protein
MTLKKDVPLNDDESPESIRALAREHLVNASQRLVEARTLIEQLEEEKFEMSHFLGALTMFLGPIGEAAYQLGHPNEIKKRKI